MNRRQFIQRGAAAGAALGFPAIVPSSVFGANAPSNRVILGHIGCGGQGGGIFRNISGSGQYLAVCDPYKSKREAFAARAGSGCRAYGDFRELLARDDIDAVSIATQDSWHVPITIAAAKAGKDIYCEKPLGVSIAENKACLAAVRRYGRMFQYGTQQRSSAHCRAGCERVRNHRCGKIHTIEVWAPNDRGGGGSTQPIPVPDDLDYDMWLGPIPYSPYTSNRCGGGQGSWHVYDNSLGFIAGWGAHPLDIAVWGYDFSRAGNITVEGSGKIPDKGLFDCVYDWDLTYRFDNGLTMLLHTGHNNTKFTGDDGWIEIARSRWGASHPDVMTEPLGPGELRLVESKEHGASFVESVRTRRDPVSTIEDAYYSDLLSHLGDIAIRLGRKIRWDAKLQSIVGDESAERMMSRAVRKPWRI